MLELEKHFIWNHRAQGSPSHSHTRIQFYCIFWYALWSNPNLHPNNRLNFKHMEYKFHVFFTVHFLKMHCKEQGDLTGSSHPMIKNYWYSSYMFHHDVLVWVALFGDVAVDSFHRNNSPDLHELYILRLHKPTSNFLKVVQFCNVHSIQACCAPD